MTKEPNIMTAAAIPPSPPEDWWSWEKSPPPDLLREGLTPMIRPRWRVQDDDPMSTAQHAMAQANNELEDLRALMSGIGGTVTGDVKVGLLHQDLGGYHKRPDEERTLFDPDMPSDRVIENIQWWRNAFGYFLSMWHSQEVWNPDFIPRPRIHSLHFDWEWAWIFGEDSSERDWRVAMVTQPALELKYRPVMTNWTCLQFLNTVNCVCYSPVDAKIEKAISTVRKSGLPKSVWITAATRENRRGETFTPEIQKQLVRTLRSEGFGTFIYWYTESTDEDWKALVQSMRGTH